MQLSFLGTAEGRVKHPSGKTAAYVEAQFYCSTHPIWCQGDSVVRVCCFTHGGGRKISRKNGVRKEECA